jgi:hypothetical protein
MKTILIAFFDIKVTVHFEFIPQGQTVSQSYYVEILKGLYEAMCTKSPEVWPSVWILHHDNAPAHKALSVRQFLGQISVTEMECTFCSPDLALKDFWLFPEIKSASNGQRFQDIEDINKM